MGKIILSSSLRSGDLRHQNQGKEPLLDDLQLAYLWQRLQTPPADGGLWNSRIR